MEILLAPAALLLYDATLEPDSEKLLDRLGGVGCGTAEATMTAEEDLRSTAEVLRGGNCVGESRRGYSTGEGGHAET